MITAPDGFLAAGVTAGLKPSGRPDLALVHNVGPEDAAAAVLTSNRVQAAPVRLTRAAVADGRLRAVILNSGGANACTGPEGEADARAMAADVATCLDVAADDVAVCSTGLIGVRLPMDRVSSGIGRACTALTPDGGPAAADAICTTDTVRKEAVWTHEDGWCVGGMAKGAGMLAPGLATMLVVLTTDASVTPATLQAALAEACRTTFDRADSDGCMSTNDTVLALANGASGCTPAAGILTEALRTVCADLAGQLIADAEGADHEIAVVVRGAADEDDAVLVGRAVARSNLFKCAIAGGDPNWGRVLAALGTTSAAFDPDAVDVAFNGVQVCRAGSIGEPREGVDLSARAVRVEIDLHAGSAEATILTTDLTVAYVRENSEYST